MPNWGYTFKDRLVGMDRDRLAIASGRDLRCSPKKTREVTNAIKGMRLSDAKTFLEQVILLKQAVPFKRYNKKMGHKPGLERFKWDAGRYPEKSAKIVYDVLLNAESNGEYKGLDMEKVRVYHANTLRGRKMKRYIERAHGRSTAYFKTLTHIEIVLIETK
jgi:large subunit ribosomal protein L22